MFLLGLHTSVLASDNILGSAKASPILLVKQPAPKDISWTAQIKSNQVQSTLNVAPVRAISNRVVERIIPIERIVPAEKPAVFLGDSPRIIRRDYVKSEAEIEIARQIRTLAYNSGNIAGAPVPEPGSIAGLSAGLLGLAFQMRRFRKR
jgi:hypothetical protein